MRTDQRVLEALARVKMNEPLLLEWLKSRMELNISALVNQKDDVSVRWAQGRIQECQELLELFGDAEKILRKADR